MANIHVLKVKYLDSPASYCGSRVRITSERFNESKIIPSWYDSGTGAVDTAVYWLTKECGLTVIGIAEGKGHDYVIVSELTRSQSKGLGSLSCWNRASRQVFLDAVAHGSVISWQHINLLGEHDFSDEKPRDSVGIRSPKIDPLKRSKIWGCRTALCASVTGTCRKL
jgi:hypothetical protein